MFGQSLLRAFLAVTGFLAIAWGAITLPGFWRNHPVEYVSSRILEGAPYRADSLAELLPAVEKLEAPGTMCSPRALQAAAIIRLRVMEEGYSADQLALLDERIAAVDQAIRNSLACAPADPFLWTVLFSVESARNGLRPEYLDYLRQSYRLGPREGWIAVRRNRVVLAVFEALPSDIASMAIEEFAALVQNHLYEDAVGIFLGPGRNVRDKLLARLATVGERERTGFATQLNAEGVNFAVPGVASPGQRPWQ